jgi:hypothetical protein
MQWTTVRLVVSETMGAVTTGNKTPQGEEAYLRFARGDETRDSALRKTTTLKQWAECRDKNGAVLSRWGRFFS